MNPLLPDKIKNAIQYCTITYRLQILIDEEDLTSEELVWIEQAEKLLKEYDKQFDKFS